MTVLTTISAAMNMPHGDRSRGNVTTAPDAGRGGEDAASAGATGVAGAAFGGVPVVGVAGSAAVGDDGDVAAGVSGPFSGIG